MKRSLGGRSGPARKLSLAWMSSAAFSLFNDNQASKRSSGREELQCDRNIGADEKSWATAALGR